MRWPTIVEFAFGIAGIYGVGSLLTGRFWDWLKLLVGLSGSVFLFSILLQTSRDPFDIGLILRTLLRVSVALWSARRLNRKLQA